MSLRSLVFSVVLLSALVGDSALLDTKVAHAQFIGDRPSNERRQIELNIHGGAYYGFNWYDSLDNGGFVYYGGYAVGPGLQMLFPVLHRGFIPSINNAFYLGFFTDFLFHPDYLDRFGSYGFFSFAFGPVAQWRFFLFPVLSVYANLGFGIWPWFADAPYGTVLRGFPLFELGANLHFTRHIGMNFEFGYPYAKVGLNIAF